MGCYISGDSVIPGVAVDTKIQNDSVGMHALSTRHVRISILIRVLLVECGWLLHSEWNYEGLNTVSLNGG